MTPNPLRPGWPMLLALLLAVPATVLAGDDDEDAGLPPERTVLKEASSDPRNLKPDAFPTIRNPQYLPALEARRMDPQEWVIGAVIGGQPLAWPVNILNHHEIVIDSREGVDFMVCW